jgi:glutaminyl-peptide cyclotransferase
VKAEFSSLRRYLPPIAVVCVSAACLNAAQPAPAKFDSNRAYEDTRQLVSIGPRVAGTPGAAAARAYITKQLQAVGITVEEQPFEATTPLGAVKMVNLRATLPAASGAQSAGKLVIGGHYDTKLFRDFRFVGANDGGSSAAFLIELGRALKSRASRVPIELLFLDGEEAVAEWQGTDHTYGSRYYVEAARKDGSLKNIRAFVLVDMIGDRDLVIKREANSTPALTDAIWSAARKLNRHEFVSETTPIEDDHLEFLAASVPSVDIIDLEYYTRSGEVAWHSKYDTMENVAAGSLQSVGDVLVSALPALENFATRPGR